MLTKEWKKWSFKKRLSYYLGLLFVLPAILNFIIFRYWPLVVNFQASLYEYSFLGGFGDFIFLDNYTRMISDPIFWKSMQVTFVYIIVRIPVQTIIALALAVLLMRQTWVNKIVRSVSFAPLVISMIVASVVWSLIFHSQLGILNSFLSIFGIPRQSFLSDPNRALMAVTFTLIWKEIGQSVIILMAGLKGIPEVYKEAAIVDGANNWQIFWSITLPLLKMVLMFVVVSQTIFAFQVFAPIYAMTQGGPLNSTKVIVYYIYQQAFRFGDAGYASALTTVLVVLLLVISAVQMRFLRSEVEF
jgi:ABC-type sugar transport system permease subunit